jgi:hypothetical protein
MRSLILSLIVSLVFISCDKQKDSWEQDIIMSENDVIMVTSVDLFQLFKKMDVGGNNQLSMDQKMMFKAFMSSFNNESLGFDVEKYHRLFILPQKGKVNAGAFLIGDVIDAKLFKDFLVNYFGASSFKGAEPTTCYVEEFNLHVAFNNQHFAAGFSPNISFAESKIQSFFNEQKSTLPNSYLEDYLTQKDDISCYLSTEKILAFLDDINNPLLKMQLPNIDELLQYGSSVNLAMNFNEGECSLAVNSNFSNNQEKKLYSSNGVDSKFRNFLTDNNELITFGFLNLIPENINNQLEQLERLGLMNEVNNLLFSLGTTTNDLLNITDGQLAFSLIDFPSSELISNSSKETYNSEDDEYWDDDEFDETDQNPNFNLPSILLSLGTQNTTELITLLNENNLSLNANEIFSLDQGLHMLIKDDVFHVSTKPILLEKIVKNGGLKSFDKLNNKYLNEPMYCEINLDLNNWPKEITKDIFRKNEGKVIFDAVEKVIVSSNNSKGFLKIEFVDKNKNALKTIVDLILQKNVIENFI